MWPRVFVSGEKTKTTRLFSNITPPTINNAIKEQLIKQLIEEKFYPISEMVPLSLLTKCSNMAADKFEDDGGHSGTYLDKPWKNSRIYIDAKQLWTKEDSDFMDPIIECVRQQLMDLFDLPDSPTTLPVEAAFVNYYVGNGNQPRDMER